MANRTTFLRLEKPNLMSTNWGASLNNNFDRLDKNAESVNNNLQQIRNIMGENNIIGTDENYPYIHISALKVGDKVYTYTLTLREKGNLKEGESKEVYKYENDEEKINTLDKINDYTGFYIAVDYNPPEDATIPIDVDSIFGKSWFKGEIATKYTGWSANGLQPAVLFTKYKQALGGWYIPNRVGIAADGKFTNQIEWEKQFAEEAKQSYITDIPIRALNTTTYVWSLINQTENTRLSSDPVAGGYDSAFNTFVHTYIKNAEGLRNTHFSFYVHGQNQISVDYAVNGQTQETGYEVTIVIYPKTTITESVYLCITVDVPQPNNN